MSRIVTNITAMYGWTDDFLGLYCLKLLTSSPYQSNRSPGNVLFLISHGKPYTLKHKKL